MAIMSGDGENAEISTDRTSGAAALPSVWRRVRLVVPPSTAVPQLPGVVEVAGTERLPVLTTSQFDPTIVSLCQDRGVTVQAVDSMTLEEIFVANVQSRRELQLA